MYLSKQQFMPCEPGLFAVGFPIRGTTGVVPVGLYPVVVTLFAVGFPIRGTTAYHPARETKIKLPYHAVCCSELQWCNTGKPHSLVWPVLHHCNTLQQTKWYVSFVYVPLAQMVSSHRVCCSVVQ